MPPRVWQPQGSRRGTRGDGRTPRDAPADQGAVRQHGSRPPRHLEPPCRGLHRGRDHRRLRGERAVARPGAPARSIRRGGRRSGDAGHQRAFLGRRRVHGPGRCRLRRFLHPVLRQARVPQAGRAGRALALPRGLPGHGLFVRFPDRGGARRPGDASVALLPLPGRARRARLLAGFGRRGSALALRGGLSPLVFPVEHDARRDLVRRRGRRSPRHGGRSRGGGAADVAGPQGARHRRLVSPAVVGAPGPGRRLQGRRRLSDLHEGSRATPCPKRPTTSSRT